MGDRIASLPADVRSLLRTGVAITNVAQCVEELVVNALDAGATCVAVRVDLPCFKIQVVDNGKGIRQDDLQVVGERYSTSKCHEVSDLENLHYYGYRGEALASLRDITSILEINSRSQTSTHTFCKIFQQGRPLSISDSTVPRSSAGTTVTVHDLFYNLPVRKKCCNPALDLEKIRQKVESIALIKPSISLSLRNDVSGHVVLQTHKTNNILNTFTYLFGPGKSKSLTDVCGKEADFSIEGYIGKKGANKKDCQFIYINGRNVLKTKLHKVVNHQLSKSLILRRKLELSTNKFRGHIMNTSPTKTTDQHGIYVLNVTCPYKEYDITFEPAKTLVEFKNFELLQHCLEKTVTDFLKKHSLHLGILAENFVKKDPKDFIDDKNGKEVTSKTDFVGLKFKPEISTKDRNGLFSKIVKRKIISDISSSTGTSIESPDSVLTSDEKDSISNDKNDIDMDNNDELFTPLDQQMKVTTPGSPRPVVLNPTIEIKSNRNVGIRFGKETSKDNTMSKRKDSCSDDDLSEDPIPTQQRVKMLVKKNIICIDTPIVKETKINVSSLSKLRKRKNSENSTLLTKSLLEKQKKFTRLKEHTCSEEQQRDTLADTLENQDFKSKNCSTESGAMQNDVPVFTSSLQGLRKLRSKEHGTMKSQISEHSLQALRKYRSQHQVMKENQVTNQPIHNVKQGSDMSGSLSNCEDKSERIVTSAEPDPRLSVDNTTIKHVKQTLHDSEHLVEDGKSNLSVSVSNLTSLKPHEKFLCQPVHGEGVDDDRLNDQANSLKYTNTNYEMQHELQPSTSTDFSKSSPIDIEEACESIENCVAEIENIISKSNNRSNSRNISQETYKFSPSREYENFTTISQETNSNPKSFMSSDRFIQTVHSFLPSEGSQSFNKTESSPVFQTISGNTVKQGVYTTETKRKSTDADLFYTISSPQESVRQRSSFTFNHDSINKPSSSSHIANVHNTSCVDHLSETNSSSKDKGKFESLSLYRGNRDQIPESYTEEHDIYETNKINNEIYSVSKFASKNQDLSFLSYFDVSESETLEVPQTCDNQHICDNNDVPFDVYMQFMCKKSKITYDNEIDSSLVCNETMPDVDESQPFYRQTQEFVVLEDSGIATDYKGMEITDDEESEIYLKFQKYVPNFERSTLVSPCLSEGFSPIIDTEESSLSDEDSQNNSGPHLEITQPIVEQESQTNSSSSNYFIETYETSDNIKSMAVKSRLDEKSGDLTKDQHEMPSVYMPKKLFALDDVKTSNPANQNNPLLDNDNISKESSGTIFEDRMDYSNEIFSISDSTSLHYKPQHRSFNSNSITENTYLVSQSSDETFSSNAKNSKQIPNQHCNETDSHCIIMSETDELQEVSDIDNGCRKDINISDKNILCHSPPSLSTGRSDAELFSPEGDRELKEVETQVRKIDSDTINVVTTPCSKGKMITTEDCFSPDGDSELRNVQLDCKTWIEMTDPVSGTKLYVNTRSGHSVKSTEWTPPEDSIQHKTENKSTPVHTGRNIPVLSPKSSKSLKNLMDQHLSKDDDDLGSIKWKNTDQINTETRKVEDLFKEWENPVFNMPAKVLGQVDNKFIACSLQIGESTSSDKEMLCLIDQHAAHERIRLETFTKEAYDVKDGEKMICCTELVSEEELTFPEQIIRVITSFTEEFSRIGIRFSSDRNKRDSIKLHTVPSCFVQKDQSSGKIRKDTSAIKAAEVLQDTRGSRGRMPNTIHKALCSQACHGAIKFGDPLTLHECEELLKSLTKCKLPFQCAHGRPSVVPLIQLGDRNQERKRPNLWKVAKHLQQ
ncbi:DNA mismatch repair protein MLH3 [Mytilus galloprovincialis]|uniref:DNA mismatch repair protein MLH3 n=1 Tax=Mytilus galloprovincialis TaxID=29158 RepID=A0A8B6EN39_MYTGA|nr:DNA mismatch repair protein MLH3 [Mytilus galloprovincialis]